MFYQWTVLAIVFCVGNLIGADPIERNLPVATKFVILHNNDMHARFEQINIDGDICSREDAALEMCFGGFARLTSVIRKYRTDARRAGEPPVFYLNAGDTYAGSPYFTIFKHKIASDFLKRVYPDAMSLGNHEFDEKVEGLIPFLNEVNFPVLACNLNLTNEPELAANKKLANSTILMANGTKIGIIGYVTPETKTSTAKNNVIFNDEIVSINAEAAKLKEQGIHIIIALGHSGYWKDQEIAKNCPEVDIVIGGHTNTFLSNNATGHERIDGPYPTIVTQMGGKRVPVVQAYAYTKYLGKLYVEFDRNGDLIDYNGDVILLDNSFAQEKEVLDLLELYRKNVTVLEQTVVGHTKSHLDGQSIVCRSVECNLGNLITDAMIFSRAMENQSVDYWTDAAIAVQQSGAIRSSIKRKFDGVITKNDIYAILPFGGDLQVTRLTGKAIRNILEHSVAHKESGGFLQLSGIHVVYNMNRPEGSRVVSVKVRCADCPVPAYSNLNDLDTHNVIVPQFLFDGGNGYNMIDDMHPVTQRMQKNLAEALYQYLEHRDFVYPEIEGRIVFLNENTIKKSAASKVRSNMYPAMLLIVFVVKQLF